MHMAGFCSQPNHRRNGLQRPWIPDCAGTESWPLNTETAAFREYDCIESAEAVGWQVPIDTEPLGNSSSMPVPQSNVKRYDDTKLIAFKHQVGDKMRSRSLPSSLSFQQQNKAIQGVAAPVRILRTPSAPRLITVRRKPMVHLAIEVEHNTVCNGGLQDQKHPEIVSSGSIAGVERTKHDSVKASSEAQFTMPYRKSRRSDNIAIDPKSPATVNKPINVLALAPASQERDSRFVHHASSRPYAEFLHSRRCQEGLLRREGRMHGSSNKDRTHIPRPTKATPGSLSRPLSQHYSSKQENSSTSLPLAKGSLSARNVGHQRGHSQIDDCQNDHGNDSLDPGSDETPTERDYSTKHLSAHGVPGCGPTMRVHRSADRIIMGRPTRLVDVNTSPRRSSHFFKDHGYSPKAAQVLGLDLTPADERQIRLALSSAVTQETDLGDEVRGKPEPMSSNGWSSADDESKAATAVTPLECCGRNVIDRNLPDILSQAVHSHHGESLFTTEPQKDCSDLCDPFLDKRHASNGQLEATSKHSDGRLYHTSTTATQKAQKRPNVGAVDDAGTWISLCKPGNFKQQGRRHTSHAVTKPCINKGTDVLEDAYRKFDETYDSYVQGLVAEPSMRSGQRNFAIESPQSFPTRTSSLQPGTSKLTKLTAAGRFAKNCPRVMRQDADRLFLEGSRLSSRPGSGLQDVANQAHIETKDMASDKPDQLLGLDGRESFEFASKASGLVQTYGPDDRDMCDKIVPSRDHTNDSRRKGMLGTVRNMFHKRTHVQHHGDPQMSANLADGRQDDASPVKSYKASDRVMVGAIKMQRRSNGRHLDTIGMRVAGSRFSQISSSPGVYAPQQGPAAPLKRVPLPAAMRSNTAGQVGMVKAQLTSQTPRDKLAQDVGGKMIGINRTPAWNSPRAANSANARHNTFRELAKVTKEFLAEAENGQQYAADKELDRTMNMARNIVRQACNEDMRSPRKQKLIDMGQLMVESCCAARDSLKAVHEAKLASRRAEMAHAHCLTSVSQMAKVIEEWKKAEDSHNV